MEHSGPLAWLKANAPSLTVAAGVLSTAARKLLAPGIEARRFEKLERTVAVAQTEHRAIAETVHELRDTQREMAGDLADVREGVAEMRGILKAWGKAE